MGKPKIYWKDPNTGKTHLLKFINGAALFDEDWEDVHCPGCGESMFLGSHFKGTRIMCLKCGEKFILTRDFNMKRKKK